MTNSVVISTMLKDYEGVIAAKTGHISAHEAGSIEYTGHEVLELPQWEGKVSFSVEGAESPLSRRYTGALLMILQEAVGNALRHGKAKHVRVRVVFGWRGLAMLVMDDGCGFDAASAASAPGVHLGLQSMRSRAEKIGGRFAVRSVPGHGTEVKVMLEAKP